MLLVAAGAVERGDAAGKDDAGADADADADADDGIAEIPEHTCRHKRPLPQIAAAGVLAMEPSVHHTFAGAETQHIAGIDDECVLDVLVVAVVVVVTGEATDDEQDENV